jgi:hypothetical protein
LEYIERDIEAEKLVKKKLATKAMLRKVKLYIENTAFDDSRILKKRGGCSGISVLPQDEIFKKVKSTDHSGEFGDVTVLKQSGKDIETQAKIAEAKNKVFKSFQGGDCSKTDQEMAETDQGKKFA